MKFIKLSNLKISSHISTLTTATIQCWPAAFYYGLIGSQQRHRP